MSNLKVSIGDGGPVVAQSDRTGWRMIVRGEVHASGRLPHDLHAALRELAISERDLAQDAFGVVMNCAGSWEDENTGVCMARRRSRSMSGWSASSTEASPWSARTASS